MQDFGDLLLERMSTHLVHQQMQCCLPSSKAGSAGKRTRWRVSAWVALLLRNGASPLQINTPACAGRRMVVEDVCLSGDGSAAGSWVRRLVFEANRSLVQSEAALAGVPTGPIAACADKLAPATPPQTTGVTGAAGADAAGARKKKGKKKAGGAQPAGAKGSGSTAHADGAPLRPMRVDHSMLCSAYHAAIVSGLALVGAAPCACSQVFG